MAARESGEYLANLLKIWDLEPSETSELVLNLAKPPWATSPARLQHTSSALPAAPSLRPWDRNTARSLDELGAGIDATVKESLGTVSPPAGNSQLKPTHPRPRVLESKSWDAPQAELSQSSRTDSRLKEKMCYTCKYLNEPGANWCVECGTALTGHSPVGTQAPTANWREESCGIKSNHVELETCEHQLSLETHGTDSLLRGLGTTRLPLVPLSTGFSPEIGDHPHIPTSSPSSPSWKPHAKLPNGCSDQGNIGPCHAKQDSSLHTVHVPTRTGNNSDAKLSVPTKSLSTKEILKCNHQTKAFPTLYNKPSYHRHWENSSTFYMWRKPSSSPLGKVKENPRNQNGVDFQREVVSQNVRVNLPPGVPRLDIHQLKTRGTAGKKIVSTSQTPASESFSSMRGPSHLLSLPDELLLMVLLYLGRPDLLRIMFVCSRLYRIACDPVFWKSVCVVLQRQKYLTSELLATVAVRQPQQLTFDNCWTTVVLKDLQAFFQQLSNSLRSLVVNSCYFHIPQSGDVLLTTAVLHCPLLSSITISWTQLSDRALLYASQHCERVEEICLEQTPEVTLTGLRTLVGQHRKWLSTLKLKGRLSFSASGALRDCGWQLGNVQSFGASYTQFEVEDVEQIRENLPNLKLLEIQVIVLMEPVAKELSLIQQLTSLHIKSLAPVSAGCLTHISNMKLLRLLDVDSTDDDGIQALSTSTRLQFKSQTQVHTENGSLYRVILGV